MGQWNWAQPAPSPAGTTALAPLPKDRDMVFYRIDDGALGWLIGHVAIRHWATFGPRYPNPAILLSSGQYLDTRGLNALTRAQFQAAARAMQAQLTDGLITQAVHRMPPAAFALEGPYLIQALRARREALPALANHMYALLARQPKVGGSAQPERFEVHRYTDSTVVAVYPIQASAADNRQALYRRTFFPAETREIQLDGLGGNDVFVLKEHGSTPVVRPRLRIYGGPEIDELQRTKSTRGVKYSNGNAPARRAYDRPPEE
ncbi:hypothetical protein ACFQT0_16360 [Hymenobacter humi]|uniref:Uncharacterized protein n=1 Tax=Hymenobacter humi TaxID=1411620 RepID=A0ABW2U799_9BACT